MDLIRETYNLLNHHLGGEHRGSKRLGPEHDDLKKGVQSLVLHAFKLGKVLGAEDIKVGLAKEYSLITEVTDKEYIRLRTELNENQYKSVTDVSE